MKIKISNLSDGVHTFNFNEPVTEINLDKPFLGNIKVTVKLAKMNNQIILDTEILLNADFECDRCTSQFSSIVKNSYRTVYLFGQEMQPDEISDITYLPVDADKIDITDDIRDYAVLAVPMKKLCKEDCKGLCARCGKDLNEGECNCAKEEIDPRWLPLMELKNKLNIN